MVLVNVKLNEKNQFLYETTATTEISELIKQLVFGKFYN
jgi:hypothetical protein